MTARLAPLSALLAAVLAITLVGPMLRGDEGAGAPVDLTAAATNRPTPGDFRGYGFDQCLAPTQKSMDAWLNHSPFLAVGIYISGNSRACRSQPNLTPAWVASQLARGWHLLPITLGPQASCSSRYPKYRDDPTIDPTPDDNYARARSQGRREAEKAVAVAGSLGIVARSTLFYDLEAFDLGDTRCRESAIRFVHGWTNRLHELGYLSGFYSSAGSGIKMLDTVRAKSSTTYAGLSLPDRLWIARWDGRADTAVSTEYLASTAWMPTRRVKQYQGGHNETWGGVTINIDRNFLDLGRSTTAAKETHCGGVSVDFPVYLGVSPRTATGVAPNGPTVVALKCLLKEAGVFDGLMTPDYGGRLRTAVYAWQGKHGMPLTTDWRRRHWMVLLSEGTRPVLKRGSLGRDVRRAQRTLNAAMPGLRLPITGYFGPETSNAVAAYREQVGLRRTGIVESTAWAALQSARS
ncbi:MAG TPA: glycoside hydrolase domain-containing protein [Nocardioides sp.]|nr:glycoside hydrolase domain-containing protein [Nocardioides sp.]